MTQSAKMAAHMYNVSRGVALLGNNCLLFRRCNSVVFHCKRHVRAVRRKPGSVISPDGERNALIKSNRSAELNQKLSDKGAKESNGFPKHPTKRESLRESEISAHLKIKLGGLRYEKATGGDDRLAKVASIARSRTFREKERKVLLEGRRLISDALAAGASPQMVFFSRLERLQELPLKNLQQAKLIKVKHEDMKTWSDLVTPQGVIAIFSKPDASCLAFPKDVRLQSVPLFLICDNMRDAGNLGTVLRCAAAAGCERVLLTKGCVDAWEPKVLRAAMGAHFRLPVFPSLDWDDIPAHLPKDAVVHVAENCNSATWWSEPAAGSEEYDESDSGEESDDERSFPHMEPRVYGESWAQGNTALVIGGERLGVSLEVLRFVEKTQGNRLYVPMAPGVSSLSSAMTASVLLFEGRRQLLELARKTRQRSKTRH